MAQRPVNSSAWNPDLILLSVLDMIPLSANVASALSVAEIGNPEIETVTSGWVNEIHIWDRLSFQFIQEYYIL